MKRIHKVERLSFKLSVCSARAPLRWRPTTGPWMPVVGGRPWSSRHWQWLWCLTCYADGSPPLRQRNQAFTSVWDKVAMVCWFCFQKFFFHLFLSFFFFWQKSYFWALMATACSGWLHSAGGLLIEMCISEFRKCFLVSSSGRFWFASKCPLHVLARRS